MQRTGVVKDDVMQRTTNNEILDVCVRVAVLGSEWLQVEGLVDMA